MVDGMAARSGLLYVALVGGALGLSWVALERGLAPLAIVIGVTALGAAAVALAEQLMPFRAEWRRPHGDLQTDVLHLVCTTSLVAGGRWLNGAALGAFGVDASSLAPSLWPARWPLGAQLGLALIVEELAGYWIHRAQHEVPLFWRFHAIHHSAPRLYWLNQLRNHPVDALVSSLAMAPLVLGGAPERVLVLFGATSTVHVLLQHANVDLRLGALDRLLSLGRAHRWHHSRVIAESNANYGSLLLVWDTLFGTRYWSEREPPVDTGLADGRQLPPDYLGQLAAPFR
jgi:sterol desaturase/sphingolipid hydroxylase (fatty acid hydroxylase superfamily)